MMQVEWNWTERGKKAFPKSCGVWTHARLGLQDDRSSMRTYWIPSKRVSLTTAHTCDAEVPMVIALVQDLRAEHFKPPRRDGLRP